MDIGVPAGRHPRLRLFLLSNAADIEVLAPAQLRAEVYKTLRNALGQYERPAHESHSH